MEPTRALHGKVLGGIWAGTGKRDNAVEGAPANPPGQNGQGQNELGGCLSPACVASPLEGLPRNAHLHQGDPRSERGSWARAGRRPPAGDGDGGREANVLLRKTKRRRASRKLGDGDGVPKPTSSSGKPRGGRRAG